jgi:hypothetical protein
MLPRFIHPNVRGLPECTEFRRWSTTIMNDGDTRQLAGYQSAESDRELGDDTPQQSRDRSD